MDAAAQGDPRSTIDRLVDEADAGDYFELWPGQSLVDRLNADDPSTIRTIAEPEPPPYREGRRIAGVPVGGPRSTIDRLVDEAGGDDLAVTADDADHNTL